MATPTTPAALAASSVAPRTGTIYPAPYAARVAGRERRALGDPFGLANFGVNLTRLPPGCGSALHHAHSRQDEFIYIVEGTPHLVLDRGETLLGPGMCAGFKAGGEAHHLENRSDKDVVYIEIGDRSAGDTANYPDDDLALRPGPPGKPPIPVHKDGTPY
jgi:uncharacterized cupin superfamily protein